mmetsp:Transcript_5602/g.14305  ORF Transcript_5602/g.14305 Transcript_5602/m.14305 type:complete len:255 (-) Transcript_5602:794-1558(-)
MGLSPPTLYSKRVPDRSWHQRAPCAVDRAHGGRGRHSGATGGRVPPVRRDGDGRAGTRAAVPPRGRRVPLKLPHACWGGADSLCGSTSNARSDERAPAPAADAAALHPALRASGHPRDPANGDGGRGGRDHGRASGIRSGQHTMHATWPRAGPSALGNRRSVANAAGADERGHLDRRRRQPPAREVCVERGGIQAAAPWPTAATVTRTHARRCVAHCPCRLRLPRRPPHVRVTTDRARHRGGGRRRRRKVGRVA